MSVRKSRVQIIKSLIWKHHDMKNITRGEFMVLTALANFPEKNGVRFPSFETLARAARVSLRTAKYAIKAAVALGIVSRTQRSVRNGWRWVRTSNAYRFIVGKVERADPSLKRPWASVSSKCKDCTGPFIDIKNTSSNRESGHSVGDWLKILAGMDQGMSPREAGYRGPAENGS